MNNEKLKVNVVYTDSEPIEEILIEHYVQILKESEGK